MRATVRGPLIVVTCATLSACYQAHERTVPDDAATDANEASDAWSSTLSDAWTDPDVSAWDGGPCSFVSEIWAGPCTAERDAECLRRAMVLAYGRFGHARCVTDGPPGSRPESYCTVGDYCPDGPPTDGTTTCRCTPTRDCISGVDVCVSDTIDGPTYCAPICVHH